MALWSVVLASVAEMEITKIMDHGNPQDRIALPHLPDAVLAAIWAACDSKARRALYSSCRGLRAGLSQVITTCSAYLSVDGAVPRNAHLAVLRVVAQQQHEAGVHEVQSLVAAAQGAMRSAHTLELQVC